MGAASGEVRIAVIGGGFCGLAAAYELSRRGVQALVFEREEDIGGLAGSFKVEGVRLEKFYHHWFTSDEHVLDLVDALGCRGEVVSRASRTGMYYAGNFFRLSTPLDLIRFSALPFADRLRLGVLALRARRVRDWRALESKTAVEWLIELGGQRVYDVVWSPLLRGKFGHYADEVSAVWFWNKLKLRGGSRGRGGAEELAYFRGGFAALADRVADAVRAAGGEIFTDCAVRGLESSGDRIVALSCGDRRFEVDGAVATAPLPDVADLLEGHVASANLEALRRIRYLANVCLVLVLDRSLSDTYWLNVADPGFPFVGVIEHTNFEPPASYADRHIVYLSKYLPEEDSLYQGSDEHVIAYCLTHLRRMFPEFHESWVLQAHVWRARYSQPIVERNYGSLLHDLDLPLSNFELASMAQIYPQDRGTNYAIGQGRAAAARLLGTLADSS